VPSASRRASGNKSDKAVADFVFVPARQMVPEKLRALYVTGGRRQSCVREFGSQTKLSASRASQRFQTPRHFLRVFPAVERRDAKVTFALCTETRARRDDDVQLAQHPVEQLPAC